MSEAIGLDVGADAIKFVRLRARDGRLELLRAGKVELQQLGRLEDGPEKRVALGNRVNEALGSAGRGRTVFSVPGTSTIARYLRMPPAPDWRVERLVRFEAEEQSTKTEPSAYDHGVLAVPGANFTVLLGLARERDVEAALSNLGSRRSGADCDLPSLAVFNAYRHGHGPEEGTVLLLDIGARETHICVADGADLYFARTILGGGRKFTQAIAETLEVSFEDAERIKREEGDLFPEGETADRLREALTREATALCNGIDASILYCKAQTHFRKLEIRKILVTGGGSCLRGLDRFLSGRLKLPVERLEIFRRISLGRLKTEEIDELDANDTRFAASAGLAASRLQRSFAFSLLPEHEKEKRRFLGRGLYLWYAAAVAIVAGVALIYGAVRNYCDARAEFDRHKALLQEAKKEVAEFKALKRSHERRKHELEALRTRVYSGEDLLRCLSQLKKCTRDDIWLGQVTTLRPRLPGDDPGRRVAHTTFQSSRTIYIGGWARAKSDTDAFNLFEDMLARLKEKKKLFADGRRLWHSFGIKKIGEQYQKGFLLEMRLTDKGEDNE